MRNVAIWRRQMLHIVAMCGLHTRAREGNYGRKRGKIAQDCSVTEEDKSTKFGRYIGRCLGELLFVAGDDAADDEGEDGVDSPENEGCDDCCGGDVGAEAFEDCHCPCATHGDFCGGNIRGDGDEQVVQRQRDEHGQCIETDAAEEQCKEQLEAEHRIAHE